MQASHDPRHMQTDQAGLTERRNGQTPDILEVRSQTTVSPLRRVFMRDALGEFCNFYTRSINSPILAGDEGRGHNLIRLHSISYPTRRQCSNNPRCSPLISPAPTRHPEKCNGSVYEQPFHFPARDFHSFRKFEDPSNGPASPAWSTFYTPVNVFT